MKTKKGAGVIFCLYMIVFEHFRKKTNICWAGNIQDGRGRNGLNSYAKRHGAAAEAAAAPWRFGFYNNLFAEFRQGYIVLKTE